MSVLSVHVVHPRLCAVCSLCRGGRLVMPHDKTKHLAMILSPSNSLFCCTHLKSVPGLHNPLFFSQRKNMKFVELIFTILHLSTNRVFVYYSYNFLYLRFVTIICIWPVSELGLKKVSQKAFARITQF